MQTPLQLKALGIFCKTNSAKVCNMFKFAVAERRISLMEVNKTNVDSVEIPSEEVQNG